MVLLAKKNGYSRTVSAIATSAEKLLKTVLAVVSIDKQAR